MHVLELNDAELALFRDGEALWREPGVACLAEPAPRFGHDALAASRLHPQHTQSQYFGRMNADPVSPGAPGIANQADLVYRHLCRMKAATKLGDAEPLHVLVPGSCTAEQLALLLGIAQEAKLQVAAFIDAAVAAVAGAPSTGAVQVVDLALHRAVATTISAAETIRRERVEDVAEAGLLRLLEGWVDAVADRFVAETRFDPLRVAATEQQVFDQVHAAFADAAGGEGELSVETEHRGVARAVALPWAALQDKSEQRYERLAQRLDAPRIALTHRAARLPQLQAFLAARGHEVQALPATAASDGASATATTLAADGAVQFLAALPRREAAARPAPAPLGTHLLCGAVAIALGEAFDAARHPEASGAFRIVRRADAHCVVPTGSAPVTVAGRLATAATPVAPGDAIGCNGREFRIVRVVEA